MRVAAPLVLRAGDEEELRRIADSPTRRCRVGTVGPDGAAGGQGPIAHRMSRRELGEHPHWYAARVDPGGTQNASVAYSSFNLASGCRCGSAVALLPRTRTPRHQLFGSYGPTTHQTRRSHR